MSSIQGLDKLRKKLDVLASDSIYEKALGQSGAIVEATAMKEVPVDTGILRSSISTTVDMSKLEATVGTNLEYAPYVEYGTGLFATQGGGRNTAWSYQNSKGQWVTTKGQRAQPFLGPALRQNRDKIIEHFNKVLEEAMDK